MENELIPQSPMGYQPSELIGTQSIEQTREQLTTTARTLSMVQSGSVTGTQIGNASLDQVNGGTLSLGGNSNQGGAVKIVDSSGNTVVTLDVNGLENFDTSGNKLVTVDSTGFNNYDTGGNTLVTIDSSGVTMNGNTTLGFAPAAGFGQYGNIGALTGSFQLQAALGIIMKFVCNTDAEFDMGAFSAGTLTVNGNFTVTGTKAATVETSQGKKQFFAAESPDETWFFTFAKVKGFWFFKKLVVDPLFYECTEGPYLEVKTSKRGLVQLWGRRKGYATSDLS